MAEAFIKICRKMLRWEWYSNVNTRILFFHCLLKANWEPGSWHGIDYEAGEFITSLPNLATGCGLSIQQTRTALSNLQSTGEITVKSFSKGRIIAINNWSKYQSVTDKITENQQEDNRQPNSQSTDNLTSVKEYKNIKNKESNNKKDKEPKHKYGEYQHVLLTDKEQAKLVEEYGMNKAFEAVNFLDAYIEEKGYKAKSHYLSIRRRVMDALNKDKQAKGKQNKFIPSTDRGYTAEFYKQLEEENKGW